jgi:VanZ family protein
MNQNWVRIAAWASIAALFLVTDGPIGLRPETALSPNAERFVALLFIGVLVAMAYPRRACLGPLLLCIAVILFEALQIFVSGRHAHLRDVMFKCAGALTGVSIVYGGSFLRRSWRKR